VSSGLHRFPQVFLDWRSLISLFFLFLSVCVAKKRPKQLELELRVELLPNLYALKLNSGFENFFPGKMPQPQFLSPRSGSMLVEQAI